MKADAIGYEVRSYLGTSKVMPEPKLLQWISTDVDTTLTVYVEILNIAGSSTDISIPVDEDTNTVASFFWDTAGAAETDLTIKTNGDTDARAVKPLRVLSEKITSLTVTNAASSAKQLGFARIVTSDSTNIDLKEIENVV